MSCYYYIYFALSRLTYTNDYNTRPHLLRSLLEGPESLDVGVQEGHAVICHSVFLGESAYPGLHCPKIVSRQLREEVV